MPQIVNEVNQWRVASKTTGLTGKIAQTKSYSNSTRPTCSISQARGFMPASKSAGLEGEIHKVAQSSFYDTNIYSVLEHERMPDETSLEG